MINKVAKKKIQGVQSSYIFSQGIDRHLYIKALDIFHNRIGNDDVCEGAHHAIAITWTCP